MNVADDNTWERYNLAPQVIVSNFSRIYHQNQRADKRKAQKVGTELYNDLMGIFISERLRENPEKAFMQLLIEKFALLSIC